MILWKKSERKKKKRVSREEKKRGDAEGKNKEIPSGSYEKTRNYKREAISS